VRPQARVLGHLIQLVGKNGIALLTREQSTALRLELEAAEVEVTRFERENRPTEPGTAKPVVTPLWAQVDPLDGIKG